ncbi:hypothetical protein ACHHYP_02723 [Achlya hypogyna]|uniref:E2F/DP family winged-helix DNA-binding domain-containing protein n=1 Tax=Achlya hypogyna TaxID=1202772 RepID=A0A1V9Z5S0_ACHHY|nr:hypothetical protein ACHHYP_02723 [Achlya hypogyna]
MARKYSTGGTPVKIKPRTSVKGVKKERAPEELDVDPYPPSASLALKERFVLRAAAIGTKTISNVCELVLELLRELQQSCPEFPVVLRANWMEEVLGLPRRRIYDVLHILQAIGLLSKRVSSDGLNGQGHMFYGDYCVVPTESLLLLQHKTKENRPTQGADPDDDEKWPALSLATLKFIKFLLANGNAIRRHLIHTIEDEKPTAAIPATKGRRMYDVLAVLTQCNIVWTNTDMGVKYIYLNEDLLDPKASFSIFRDPLEPKGNKRALVLDDDEPSPPPKRPRRVKLVSPHACEELPLSGLFGAKTCRCRWLVDTAPDDAVPDAHWRSLVALGASILDVWSHAPDTSLECYEGIDTIDDYL